MSAKAHTPTDSKVVIFDKTCDPQLGRLGYPLLPNAKAYRKLLKRREIDVVLLNLANISADDALLLQDAHEAAQGSLIYLGISSGQGDQATQALIGPDIALEKLIPKTYDRTKIDFLANFYRKRRTLQNQLHHKQQPNTPVRNGTDRQQPQKQGRLAARKNASSRAGRTTKKVRRTKQSGSARRPQRRKFPRFKMTHYIFLCLVFSGAIVITFVADLMISPPEQVSSEIVVRSLQQKPSGPQVRTTTQVPSSVPTPKPVQQTLAPLLPQPASSQNINRVPAQIPRLPSNAPTGTAPEPYTPSPYVTERATLRTPKQAVTDTPIEAQDLWSSLKPQATVKPEEKGNKATSRTAVAKPANTTTPKPRPKPTLTTKSERITEEAPKTVITPRPVIVIRDKDIGVLQPSAKTPTQAQVPTQAKTPTQAQVPTQAKTQTQAKVPTPTKARQTPQYNEPATILPAPVTLSASDNLAISEYNALAITQIQQKVYLPASRKSALHYFAKIYQISGPQRTAKSLANNILGNILKDANTAIKKRDSLALARTIEDLRSLDTYVRSFTQDIHTQRSYQRLLSRYYSSVNRSEPILPQEMPLKERNYFRSALKELRQVVSDICLRCSSTS